MKQVSVGRFLWYLFAVPHCAACRKLLSPQDALGRYAGCDVLCPECRANWENEKLALCSVCGEAHIDCRCMPEVLRQAGAEGMIHLGEYRADSAIGRTVLRLKDTALHRAANFAAAQLAPAFRRLCADALRRPEQVIVTYLPCRIDARRKCGHDQAELIARALAHHLGAKCMPMLQRTGGAAPQKSLSGSARKENAQKAFMLAHHAEPAGKTVILVDDVITTGSTMEAGVRILREAGAAAVFCAVLGVTAEKKR